jgi:uncharacterized protein (UPF0335 family)
MNKELREHLKKISSELKRLENEIGEIRDKEHTAYHNLPHGFDTSVDGEMMAENVDLLTKAENTIKEAIDYIRNVMNDVVGRGVH